MAVQLFDSEGNSILIKPSSLQAHLEAGWLLDDPLNPPAKPEPPYKPLDVEPDADEKAEDDAALAQMGIKNPEPVGQKKQTQAKRKRGRPRKK